MYSYWIYTDLNINNNMFLRCCNLVFFFKNETNYCSFTKYIEHANVLTSKNARRVLF